MRSKGVDYDPVLAYATTLYISNELLSSNKNHQKDYVKLKTDYHLSNKLLRHVRSPTGHYIDLAKLPSYPKTRVATPSSAEDTKSVQPKKNLNIKVTTTSKTTTTTTTTTNRFTSNTVSKIKPNVFFPLNLSNEDITKNQTQINKFLNKDKATLNSSEKRYAKFGRDITEKLVENIQAIEASPKNSVSFRQKFRVFKLFSGIFRADEN